MVPACCERLAYEAGFCEACLVEAFAELLGGETVAVGGERVVGCRRGAVGGVEEGGGEEAPFDGGELGVDWIGDTGRGETVSSLNNKGCGRAKEWGLGKAYNMFIRLRRFST